MVYFNAGHNRSEDRSNLKTTLEPHTRNLQEVQHDQIL